MKTIYMTLSGLILSVLASIAIAGLISVSKLVKPAKSQQITEVSKQHSPIKMTHKDICHQYEKEDKTSKDISFCR